MRVDVFDLQVRMDAAHRGYATLDRVVGAALEADRARLRHAVSNRDLLHVHITDDAFHDFDRAGRTGHDPGTPTGEIIVGEVRMLELRDEHGGHSVQDGAALGLECLQCHLRIKPVGRVHHGGAVSNATQVAHDHAETVIQRHRYTHPVVLGQPEGPGDKVAIVEDVEMTEGGALR